MQGAYSFRDALIVRPAEMRSFLIALAIVALARAQAMVEFTYAVDDYRQIIHGLRSIAPSLIYQGRPGEYLIYEAFDFIGFDPGRAPVISLLISVALAVWVGNAILRILAADIAGWPRSLIITVIAAHPYTFEILTFRGIFIYHVFAYAVGLYALLIARLSAGRLFAAALVFCFSLSIYQISLSLVSTIVVVDLSLRIIRRANEGHPIIDRDFVARILACAFGLAFYVVAKHFTIGPSINPRATIISIGEFPERAMVVMRLLYGHLVDGSAFWVPLVPRPVMMLPAIFIAIAAAVIIYRLRAKALIPVSVLIATPIIGGIAMMGMPLIANLLFLPPRVMPHIGILWAWSALVLLMAVHTRLWITAALALISFVFVVQNNQLFTDHARMMVRDQNLALRIYGRLEQLPEMPARVHFVRGLKPQTGSLDTTNYGLNDSVLLYYWSVPPMLTELTGRPFGGATRPEMRSADDHCKTVKPWPSPSSIQIIGDMAVVCL